jgi:hypothetical protein
MVNLLRVKLELFCHGLRVDEALEPSIKRQIVPSSEYVGRGTKRASLSEGKCFSLHHNNKSYVANLAVMESFVRSSPYEFTLVDGEGWIRREGELLVKASPTGTPSWYFEPDILRVFQVHGNDVLATALSNFCVYKQGGEGCRFCALEAGGEYVIKRPEEIKSALRRIVKNKELSSYWSVNGEKEYLDLREVNINSGSLHEERMIKLYLSAIRAIREISDIPISAQLCPIDRPRMEQLHQAGLDTISFNMEIYDEGIRGQVMPRKARLHPVEKYLEAIKDGVEVFGKNQVISWLIAGLEPPESTIAGCQAICERGGIPHLAVFRPLKGTAYENRQPPEVEEVIEIYQRLGEMIKDSGLDPFRQKAGCVRCGGCSALKEVLEN